MRHQCHNGDKEIIPITALVPQWADFLVPIEALLLSLVELVLQWGLWIMYCPHLGTTILRHIVTHVLGRLATESCFTLTQRLITIIIIILLLVVFVGTHPNPNTNPKVHQIFR